MVKILRNLYKMQNVFITSWLQDWNQKNAVQRIKYSEALRKPEMILL